MEPQSSNGRAAAARGAVAGLDRFIGALAVFTAVGSGLGLVTLALGWFSPPVIGLAALVAGIVFYIFGDGERGRDRRSGGASLRVIGAIGVVALLCRLNGGAFPFGGQDPGVYTNMGAAFARTSAATVVDPVMPLVRGEPELRAGYLRHSYLRVKERPGGRSSGIVLPGLYVKDLERGVHNSQFYHLHPVWLAIGEYVGGLRGQGLIVALFSSFTVVVLGGLIGAVTGSAVAASVGALLLALNPAHGYIGTVPLSEAVAGFFFLAALYLLTVGRLALALLPIGCLFFTRITGFVSAPLLIAGVLWIGWKRRDARAGCVAATILGLYAASFYWGLTFSPQYANDIYRGKLGLSKEQIAGGWIIFGALGGFVGAFGIVGRYARRWVEPIVHTLYRHRRALVVVTLSLVFGVIAYRLYLLSFTDTFALHRWYGKRWGIAGRGIESLERSSLYSLILMVSPFGFGAFLIGLPILLRRAFAKALVAPLAIATIGFFVVLTARQLTTPYLYYYGRYLVSELVPLVLLGGMVGVAAVVGWLRHRWSSSRVAYGTWVLFVVGCLASGAPALLARLKVTEGGNFGAALECIVRTVPDRAVILLEDGGLRETLVAMPLRMRYGRAVVSIPSDDGERRGWVASLIQRLHREGYRVVALGSKRFIPPSGVEHRIVDIPARIEIMRRVGALPLKSRTTVYDYVLWTDEPGERVDRACRSELDHGETSEGT